MAAPAYIRHLTLADLRNHVDIGAAPLEFARCRGTPLSLGGSSYNRGGLFWGRRGGIHLLQSTMEQASLTQDVTESLSAMAGWKIIKTSQKSPRIVTNP